MNCIFRLSNRLEFFKVFSKKCMLLFLAVMSNASAMDKKRIITQPYTPGVVAKYPRGAKVACLAGAVVIYGAVKTIIDVYAPGYTDSVGLNPLLLGGMFVGGAYGMNSIEPTLVDLLLTDPKQVIDTMSWARGEMRIDLQGKRDVSCMIQKLENMCNIHEQRYPLCLLQECEEKTCVLTRSINPSYRSRFEERASQLLLEKMSAHEQTNCADFGTGGAWSNLIIATKALARKPDGTINFHFIDKQYEPYVKAAHFLKVASREITSNQKPLDFGNRFDEYIKFLRGQKAMKDGEVSPSQIIIDTFIIHRRYKQFLTFLQSTFPKAKLSLFMYDSTDGYLEYIKQYKLEYADVVTAADIVYDGRIFNDGSDDGGPQDYRKLCFHTLKNKPDSSNLWLDKDHSFRNVSIETLTLEELERLSKMEKSTNI